MFRAFQNLEQKILLKIENNHIFIKDFKIPIIEKYKNLLYHKLA